MLRVSCTLDVSVVAHDGIDGAGDPFSCTVVFHDDSSGLLLPPNGESVFFSANAATVLLHDTALTHACDDAGTRSFATSGTTSPPACHCRGSGRSTSAPGPARDY